MLILLVRYQLVASNADLPFLDALQGGVVNATAT